jgi:hypothetical protein
MPTVATSAKEGRNERFVGTTYFVRAYPGNTSRGLVGGTGLWG